MTMTVAAPRADEEKMEKGAQNGKNGSRGSSDIGNNNGQKKITRSSIWTLFSHADALDVWLMTIGVIGTLGDALSLPAVFFVSSKLMNSVGNGASSSPSLFTHIINKNVVNILYIACGSAVASFFEGYCWTRTGERQASRIRARYLKAVLRQDIEYFDLQGASTSDVVTGISNDSLIIQDFLSEKVPNFILNISTFLGSYAVGFILIWRLSLVAFPTILLLIIPGIIYGKMLMSLARKIRVENSKAFTIIEQAVSSIRTVYSFVGEERTMADYSVALDGSVNYGLHRGLIQGVAIGSQGVTFAIWALMAWYGSRLVINHGSQGGSIFIVGSCINFGGISLGSALSNLKCFTEAATAGEHIMEVVRRLPNIDSESMEGETLQSILGEVEFRGVGFAYPSRPQNQILRDFNLKIPTGTTVAMVGSSGSGKSTVLALLERFYDPAEGEILLDGVDIRKFRLKWLRSQMGLVSQEPVLFSMSIRDNILFGKEDATMEEVVTAAQASYAHNFISQLPEGYETKVGERGIQMSGGQKQRIAIARAILKSPKILLLDEATSALDSESERIVQEALENASIGRTTIMIAHRLSTIQNADMIVVVQAGQVMETGSHNDLLCKADGLYSNLSRLQQITTATEEQDPGISSSIVTGTETEPSRSGTTSAGAEVVGGDPAALDKLEVHHQVSSFRRLLKLTVYEWKHSLLGFLSAIAVGTTHPIHSFCMGNLISVYFLKDDNMIMKKTRTYCLVFIGLSMLYFVGNIVQHYNFGAMGEYLTKRVRRQMLSTILTFEVGWFDKEENSTGSICSRLTNDAYLVKSLMADQMSLLVQALSGIAIAFILGLVISWQLGLVMIAAQPIIIICFYIRKVLLKSMSDKATKAQSESSKLAAEAVTDLRTITAFSSQDRILRLFELTQVAPRRESTRQSWFAGIGLGISLLMNRFTMALIFWYGGKLVSSSSISPKSFFQTYLILVNTARIIAEAGTRTNDLAKGAHAVQSIFLLLERLTLINPENPDGFHTEKIQGNVEFREVDFAYPARPQITILNRLSLTIAAGKSMALVGRSGSGKSTIIGLIERFYDPTQGTVTVDGRDIKSYHLRSLRRHIALVGQQPVLFSGSVRDNITYGTESATDTEVEDAARAANAHSFISCLQDGYKTWCGDKGVQLSGGQKQRIAIARAILKNPSILLLDEATSALDSQSENAVQEALEKVMVGRTSIVIAHRLSTVKDCDHIGVMEKGMLVEIGTHDSLLEMGPEGSYYELVRFQQGANNGSD